MHTVLATFLAMSSSTFHNIERLVPAPPGPVLASASTGSASPYAYDEDRCITRRSGAIVCRRR